MTATELISGGVLIGLAIGILMILIVIGGTRLD